MNKIREEEGVFILFLVTIAVSEGKKGKEVRPCLYLGWGMFDVIFF